MQVRTVNAEPIVGHRDWDIIVVRATPLPLLCDTVSCTQWKSVSKNLQWSVTIGQLAEMFFC
jgi:hypothetical protein